MKAIVLLVVVLGAGFALIQPDGWRQIASGVLGAIPGAQTAARDLGGGMWSVTYETDEDNPISGKKIYVARAEHKTASGGTIQLNAKCLDTNGHGFQISFHSFNGADKGVPFEYSVGSDDQGLEIVYRYDNGDQLIALNMLSRTRYTNVAEIEFGLVGKDWKPLSVELIDKTKEGVQNDSSAGDMLAGLRALPLLPLLTAAQGPQSLMAFFDATNVRFQLPLEGGAKEIIAMQPREKTFWRFWRSCYLNRDASE